MAAVAAPPAGLGLPRRGLWAVVATRHSTAAVAAAAAGGATHGGLRVPWSPAALSCCSSCRQLSESPGAIEHARANAKPAASPRKRWAQVVASSSSAGSQDSRGHQDSSRWLAATLGPPAVALGLAVALCLGAPARPSLWAGAATLPPPAGEPVSPIIDSAQVFSEAKLAELAAQLDAFERQSGWEIRVLTRTSAGTAPSGDVVRARWRPGERTVVVIEDVTAPNVLNFNTGGAVRAKLPRQFFVELQNRYGNQACTTSCRFGSPWFAHGVQFYVREEGEMQPVIRVSEALQECLSKDEGCQNVPGVTEDLYFLTLATSIAGGAVFGFAARVPPSGRVDSSLQWVLVFAPLWGILFLSLGILPIISRTSNYEPVLKNTAAFLGAAAALYLTPIFGQPPGFTQGQTGSDTEDRPER
eukprot:SM000079S22484  [mRNA]  locus=s79:452156:453733:- [translate_table: standard]